MQLYLLVMEGQGDTHVKLVTKTIWDWVHSPETPGRPPGSHGWTDPSTPASVRAVFKGQKPDEREGSEDGHVFITSGSFNNDRALAADGDEVLFDEYADADVVDEARQWALTHGHEVVDEWRGYIY